MSYRLIPSIVSSSRSVSTSDELWAAAFGDHPGRWPLPRAHSAEQHWLRAVAAGGQGHYGCARSELEAVLRAGDGPLLSLAYSTQGSLLRQLGGHRPARGWDGRALALAGDDCQARVDALVGLAADALGTGRFALSAVLLARADTALGADPYPPARLAVRLAWVGAELAMAIGDGAEALIRARCAVELASGGVSIRHRVKSNVVMAAASCCAGRLQEARTLADTALDETARHGLIPLRWAVASLLTGIGSDTRSSVQVQVMRDEAAELIRRRGGHWVNG
jgi:hypothetical protein